MNWEQFLREFGLPLTILVVLALSGARGIWVWGRELLAANARADEWKKIALRTLNAAEKVVGSDERSMGSGEETPLPSRTSATRRRR